MYLAQREPWSVPLQMVGLIAQELQSQGVAVEDYLQGSPLCPQDLATPDKPIAYRQMLELIRRGVTLSRRAGLGLDVGRRQTPAGLGLLGYAINCCATARDALLTGAKYHAVASSINRLALSEDARHAYWIATPPIDLQEALPFAIEEEFSAFCRNSELLTGKKAPLVEVHFTYDAPAYVYRYQEAFNAALRFNAPTNQIVFDVGALDLPILQGNPLSVAHGVQLCENFLANNPSTDDLTLRICAMLLRTPGVFPPAEEVAASLHMSARTLRYQLAQIGQSYQAIVERLKLQLSRDYLENSPLKVEDIAWRLGYLDARNFRRAFKAWTGVTPSEYRRTG